MQHSSSSRRYAVRGFTLLELLVVIVIIGLLAGIVAPRYMDTIGKSKAKVALAQMDSLGKALDQYRIDVGSYPSQEQGLEALTTNPGTNPKWQGPYLKKGVPLDPWDNAYIYKIIGKEIDITSLGADGREGGTDEAKDISLSAQ